MNSYFQGYLDEFLIAHTRTSDFGICAPKIDLKDTRYINAIKEVELTQAVYLEFGVLDKSDLYARCIEFCLRLKPVAEKVFNCKAYYTIGYVVLNGHEVFKSSESELKALIDNGFDGETVNIHVWLTLDSGEILDFTFSTTYAVLHGFPSMEGLTLAKHPGDLVDGMRYVPMLVGESVVATMKRASSE